MNSLVAVKKVLQEFEDLSGRKANPEKSTLFCAGVSQVLNGLLTNQGRKTASAVSWCSSDFN